ncbi:MAG: glutaredoxin family protein [Chloroflexi bacterium]|nr:MAG: glutaredoxin family protein [Chloroflexota bacterium]TMG55911.1 MAG: glutaredoxin family protein [Chloroflexota bacterium]
MMRGDIRRALALVRRRTHRGPPVEARLLEKPDCGLCAEAHRALRRVALDVPLEIERVDITKDPALFERYALRIPVVVVGERELDAAGVDDRALRAWLRG